MQSQCMAYASYLKTQDVRGSELMRVWLGTCQPTVAAGEGGPAYRIMCQSLGGAITKFMHEGSRWDAAGLCKAVLQVFKEAQVGV